MNRALTMAAVTAIVALAAVPGQAAPSEGSPIVVSGKAPDKEEAERQAIEFVRQTGIAQGQTPAARWLDPVCIKVIGLQPEYAKRVEEKFSELARSVPVALARPGCEGNLAMVFSNDGAATARHITKRDPRGVSDVPVSLRSSMYDSKLPVRWWYHIAERSRAGVRASAVPSPWTAGNSESGNSVVPMDESATMMNVHDASIVSTNVHRGIVRATVIIDTGAAAGKELDAVVSYAALVALAEIRRSDSPPAASILALFGPETAPRELTQQDLELLRTLYRIPLDRSARRHRGQLAKGLVDAALAERPGS